VESSGIMERRAAQRIGIGNVICMPTCTFFLSLSWTRINWNFIKKVAREGAVVRPFSLITYKATLLFYRRSTWKKALAHTHVHSSGKTYPHTSDVPAPPQTRPPPITHYAPTTFVSSEHTSHQPAAQCHLS